MKSPLQGIKVLDLTEEIAGPYCAMQLGDGGAEVIKVEPINGDWSRFIGARIKSESALFLALNRNKKSIAVDINKTEGKKILQQLAKDTDILVESFAPGEADKMGIGYRKLKSVNPRLIYCSLTPFGTSGPYENKTASELEIQGIAGYQWYLGEPGEARVRVGADVAQVTSGIWAFIGIVTALLQRVKSGIGQKVETSMMHGLIAIGAYFCSAHYNPDYWGGPFIEGPYNHAERGYATKDVPIGFGMPLLPDKVQKSWEVFLNKVGLSELLKDPYFREKGMRLVGMGRDAQEMKPFFENTFLEMTSEEIREIVEGEGVEGYCAIYKTYEHIFNEGQVVADQMVEEIEHPVAGTIKTTGFPWKLSKSPAQIRLAPPTLGQHTDEILINLGYSKKDIAALRQEMVVV